MTAADVLIETLIDWGVEFVSVCPATASTESWSHCAPPGQNQVYPGAPLPGKIKAKQQALHFSESIARGEPEGLDILKEALKDKAKELV